MKVPPYTKLPTRGISWPTFSRVYLAPDHVLLVEFSGFEERYRRFFLKDIEAILLRPNIRGRVMNGVFGLVGILLVAMGLTIPDGGLVILGSMGGLSFFLLLVNLFRGPTCQCYLQTRVQKHRVKACSRLAPTRRCVEKLIPLIQQAQLASPEVHMPGGIEFSSSPALPPSGPSHAAGDGQDRLL